MRLSRFLLATLKETPADAELISHQLMLRAGLIRKLASGLYTWLPLGLRVLRNIETIVRDEMDRSGALELLMPAIQPAELWQESGRWDEMGGEMLRLTDRHQRAFCFGPTHEEVITDMVRREIRSYKQLPVNFYQIQTKFRDERRPRFGVMRAREFLMKDAYSFHVDQASLQHTYDQMYATYTHIFTRLSLKFRAVLADSGAIGGDASVEFHVLADSGEDAIAFSNGSDYAANIEMAPTTIPAGTPARPTQDMTRIDTPDQHSIKEVCAFLKVHANQIVKTLIVKAADENATARGLIALVLRGDHELNTLKAAKLPGVYSPLTMANDDEISVAIGCHTGSIGPVELNLPIFVDHAAAHMTDFVCGANCDNTHLQGVNWHRDLPAPEASVDIRNIVAGDPSPDGKGSLSICRGIEVGHIFQLGQKYTQALNATCLNEQGKAVIMTMGCYGIGISRLVAAVIEQNHDDRGIIWPEAIAPFQVALLPLKMHKSERLRTAAEQLYEKLQNAGFSVLFDDRKERPGVMFANADLIGIPHRLVLGERGLDKNMIEYKHRRDSDSRDIPMQNLIEELKKTRH